MRPIKAPATSLPVIAGCAFFFLLLFTLNSFTPLWGDDWWRAVPARDFLDIFRRIGEEYYTWGGRLWVLLLTFVFLLKYPGSQVLFNLVNSAVFCLLLVGIFRGAVGRYPGRERSDTILLPFAFFSVWFFTQALGETVFWKTGAIGYLWVLTAAVYVITPFVDLLADEEPVADSRWRLWGLPVFAAVWATGLETVSLALVLFMSFALLAARLQQIPPKRWYWHVFSGQLAGTLLLVFSPGNWVRAARSDDGLGIAYRIVALSRMVWQHVTTEVPIFYALVVLLALLLWLKRRAVLRRFYFWLILGLMMAFAMAGSSGVSFGQRTAFPAEICFITALMALAGQLLALPRAQSVRAQILLLPLYGALLGVLGADLVKTTEQYLAVRQQTHRRQELMAEYKALGLGRIVLPSMRIPYIDGLKDDIVQGRFFLRDLHPEMPGNEWRNSTYAQYYGFAFANRLGVPHAICAPELADSRRFTPLGSIAGLSVYLRRESYGWRTHDVLYGISDRRPLIDLREIRVVPADARQLSFDDRGQGYHRVTAQVDVVALVAADGSRMAGRFVSRFELPDMTIERIDIEHPRLPGPHKASIRMDRKSIVLEQVAVQEMSWKGVELHHSPDATLDLRSGSIASPPGKPMRGFLNWGPYVTLSAGRYAFEAEYTTASPGSRWEIIAQTQAGPRNVVSGTLTPDEAAPQVLREAFTITPELEAAQIEFRIAPAEGQRVELFRFSIAMDQAAP